MLRPATWLVALCLGATAASQVTAGITVDLAEVDVPTVTGAYAGDRLGYALAVGDVDGDGAPEIVVSSPGRDRADGVPDAGAVYVLDAGPLSALESPVRIDDVTEASGAEVFAIVGEFSNERFGESILVADLNGDSIEDLAVGSPAWGSGPDLYAGRVSIFFGPLATDRPPNAAPFPADEIAACVVMGTRAGDRLGSSLAAADVDGEGIAELLVSAFRAADGRGTRAGSIYVIRASSLSTADRRTVSEVAIAELRGERDGDALRGMAVKRGADGAPPVLAIGAYHGDGPGGSSRDSGRVYLVRADEIASLPLHAAVEIDAPVIVGPHPRGFLGRSIAAGDVDGDGVDDLAVSAYASRLKKRKADASGEVFLVFGSDAGPPDTLDLSVASVPRFSSESRWDLFGLPMAMCDLNGDRVDDLIVASQFADHDDRRRQRCGKVYVYRGGLRSVLEAKAGKASLSDVTIVGRGSFDAIGAALAFVRDPDGAVALIVGAPDAGGDDGELSGVVHVVPSGLLSARYRAAAGGHAPGASLRP